MIDEELTQVAVSSPFQKHRTTLGSKIRLYCNQIEVIESKKLVFVYWLHSCGDAEEKEI